MTMTNLIKWFRSNYPELVQEMKNSEHGYSETESNPHHIEGDVWTHTMMVCKAAENLPIENKISALLHDIGKPASRKIIEEQRKVRFQNHEGISTFMTIPILDKMIEENIIDEKQKIQILILISWHGESWKVSSQQLMSYFNVNEYDLMKKLIDQIKADEEGRFVNSDAHSLDEDLFNYENFLTYSTKESCYETESPTITLLIGLPGCGKSTYSSKLNSTIISRDKFIEEYNTEKTYNENWKSLSDEQHKEIDQLVQIDFNRAIKNKENIIIDMTNMSRKSRRKWLMPAKQKGYISEAIVFLVSKEVCSSRRYENSGKYISNDTYKMIMGNFMMPGYDEFDIIELI